MRESERERGLKPSALLSSDTANHEQLSGGHGPLLDCARTSGHRPSRSGSSVGALLSSVEEKELGSSTRLKSKVGLKAFDDQAMQVGRFMFERCFDARVDMRLEYSRNTEDFVEVVWTDNFAEDLQEFPQTVGLERLREFARGNPAKFCEYCVLRGVPAEYVWSVWKTAVQATEAVKLIELQFMANEDIGIAASAIELDVKETLFDHPFFATKAGGRFIGREKLVKVARTLYYYFNKDWYSRGTTWLLGTLLIACGGDEVQATNFYISLSTSKCFQLNHFKKECRHFYDFLSFLFRKLLSIHDPELHHRISASNVPDNHWIKHFWVHCFTESLCIYSSVRLLDFIFSTNVFALVQVALAVVQLSRVKLLLAPVGELHILLKHLLKEPSTWRVAPTHIIWIALNSYRIEPGFVALMIEEFITAADLTEEGRTRLRGLAKAQDQGIALGLTPRFLSNISVTNIKDKIPTFKL